MRSKLAEQSHVQKIKTTRREREPGLGRSLGSSQELRQPYRLPQEGRECSPNTLPSSPGVRAEHQTPTCKVDTSTGPLSCPTRKNSTTTVFFSVRREAPERWVNSGKARARAQAEAKASARSQTICSTEESCDEGQQGDRTQDHSGSCNQAVLWAHSTVRGHSACNLDTGAPIKPSPWGLPPNHCLAT